MTGNVKKACVEVFSVSPFGSQKNSRPQMLEGFIQTFSFPTNRLAMVDRAIRAQICVSVMVDVVNINNPPYKTDGGPRLLVPSSRTC